MRLDINAFRLIKPEINSEATPLRKKNTKKMILHTVGIKGKTNVTEIIECTGISITQAYKNVRQLVAANLLCESRETNDRGFPKKYLSLPLST